MLQARLSLLPRSNPVHQIFNTATASTTTTWVSVVRDWQMHPGLPSAIPELLETCSHDDAELARGCKINRKRLVDRYKSRHVRPVLQQYDDDAFLTSTRKSHLPYGSFQQSLDSFPAALITADWDANTWRLYRAWAVIRLRDASHYMFPTQGTYQPTRTPALSLSSPLLTSNASWLYVPAHATCIHCGWPIPTGIIVHPIGPICAQDCSQAGWPQTPTTATTHRAASTL